MSKSKTYFLVKIKRLILLAVIPLALLAQAHSALADPYGCSTGSTYDSSTGKCVPNASSASSSAAPTTGPCAGLTGQDLTSCNNCQNKNDAKSCLKNNAIVVDINDIIKVLSGLVAIVVTASIIIGGIQYAISGDKAELVSAAKKRITNGLIALVIFILIFSIVQWLIPGGIFNS